MQSHKDLLVWQTAIDFAEAIYLATRSFPKDELFAMVSQMRRAATSISMNIAEGYSRATNNETIHFLYIAVGSAAEADTQIILSKRFGYLTEDQANALENQVTSIRKMLSSLIKSIKQTTK